MKPFEDFPTVTMFMAFFILSCILAYFTFGLKIAFTAFLVVLLLFIIINPTFRGRKIIRQTARRGLILTLCASIAAAVISAIAFNFYADGFEKLHGEEDFVKIKITECDYSLSYTSRYQAKIIEADKIPFGTGIILNTPLGNLEEGSVLLGRITYTSLGEYLGSFDAKNYYNPKGIMIVCEDEGELEYIKTEPYFSLTSLFTKINSRLTAMLTAHTNYESGGLASAVLLGNRSRVTDIDKRDFRRIGVSHLLVVSGTHFAVVVTFLENSLKRFKIRRKARSLISIGVILLFMGLTGMTPSVVRAGIMHIFAQLSVLITRRSNTINSFAISGTLLILLNPLCAVDCGLQLSYAATISCILIRRMRGSLLRPLNTKLRGKKKAKKFILPMAETVILTCYLTLIMLPLTWLYFGEISLLSVPANIIFIPLVTLLMYLSGLYLLLYPLRLFIVPLSAVINLFCSAITDTADFFARLDGIMLPINYTFSILFLIPLTVILIAVPFCYNKTRKKLIISAAAVFVMFTSVIGIVRAVDAGQNYITYVGINKNDGFALKSDGKIMLCEISDASYGFFYNLTDEMELMHCCEIEACLLTHYHNKHLQLISRLCQREILKNLILTEPINDTEASVYRLLLALADEYEVNVYVYSAGEEISFGDAKITLFERKYLSRSTHPITALKISVGDEDTVIASCSFNESYEEITEAIECAENIILGRHSPVYKKTFGLSFEKEPKVISVCTDALEHMDDSTRDYIAAAGAMVDAEVIRIKIPD